VLLDWQRPAEAALPLPHQVPQHSFAGLLGRDERFERRANDLNGGPVLIDWTPGGYEARGPLKAETAAARIADHERNAVAGRIPYLHVLNGTHDAAELHLAHLTPAPEHEDS